MEQLCIFRAVQSLKRSVSAESGVGVLYEADAATFPDGPVEGSWGIVTPLLHRFISLSAQCRVGALYQALAAVLVDAIVL